jgi:hypothetical protein
MSGRHGPVVLKNRTFRFVIVYSIPGIEKNERLSGIAAGVHLFFLLVNTNINPK